MAVGLKRKWTGNIRLRMERTTYHLNTLLVYNAKHPTYGLFNETEVANMNNVRTSLAYHLQEKVLK